MKETLQPAHAQVREDLPLPPPPDGPPPGRGPRGGWHEAVIPPPPPPDAKVFTLVEVAGYLRVSINRVRILRRQDPTFPKARLVSKGILRWLRSEIEAWFLALPQGWSTKGGRRDHLSRGVQPQPGATASTTNAPLSEGRSR